MKKVLPAIITLALCLGMLSACGGSQNPHGSANQELLTARGQLVGTWNQITDDGTPSLPEMGIPSAYIFYIDGTGLDTFWNMTFVYTIKDDIVHIAYDDSLGEDWDYRFTIADNVISLTRMDNDAITMLYQKEVPEEETETADGGEK